MELLALKKQINEKGLIKVWVYLVANGFNQGRWTSHFGVHCLADTSDTKEYLRFVHEQTKGSVIEYYSLEINKNKTQDG